jgi:hypothetical protein
VKPIYEYISPALAALFTTEACQRCPTHHHNHLAVPAAPHATYATAHLRHDGLT